ncbi:site-specific DNA-methyltransferase [Thermococcus stetteri]|uniref:site-specific DNA-methyltransferase n=1 Tax=Thermococcus stetteri TaxID=49900 RepID=UPI001AE43DE0|nr:DNA methyltransferase [Thermococcus stetteri]MBP1911484.1 adenine specific DNA methylase Mod [Thermococcus stetteri]
MGDSKPVPHSSEAKFFSALKDVFIGAEVEGNSGYVNLMRIKSRYFERIFKLLMKEIDEKAAEFPEFREELFDKLYGFFKRYFSESGSIYFRYTPFSEKVYERVYTDSKDVVMFWKTHMLYYVKTDILPKSMEVTVEGVRFFFDASKLEHKKANEKRELIYSLKGIRENGTIVFSVSYSERGRKTKVKEILKELKKSGVSLNQEVLEKAFRVFEKQNEVDYFINKNAGQFLKEQFEVWLYQYIYSDETQFTEKRIKQMKVLKEIAYKIIDFIAQFEDELVRIWQKPKFVLNSNYVITLDRIAKRKNGIKVIERIVDELEKQRGEFERELDKWKRIKSSGKTYRERFEEAGEITNQIAEWYLLDLIDEDFDPSAILVPTVLGRGLNLDYQFLPIDTRYFKELEPEILGLFDNLDEELDGRLIKSENWQALNTILPKFKERVQTIYIDPPFNTGSNEFTMYINRFLDSAWVTMMENRLRLARDFLKDDGSIFVRIDYHGDHYLRFLLDDIFGKENFRNEFGVRRFKKNVMEKEIKKLPEALDTIYCYSKSEAFSYVNPFKKRKGKREGFWRHMGDSSGQGKPKVFFGKVLEPPKGKHWKFSQETIDRLIEEGKLVLVCKHCGYVHDKTKGEWKGCPVCGKDDPEPRYWVEAKEEEVLDSNWTDIYGYSTGWGFPTENSEKLLKRVIQVSSKPGDTVMDFFLGSGTTVAVAHKLGRKWIGIEMGEHFYTVILPRMKKVLAYDKSGISKDEDVKKHYNEKRAGGFFKYYELEQYEDTLRRVRYADAEPLFDPAKDPYSQYVFMRDPKLLEALEVDYENNRVQVNLEKLYRNIDLAETLSNLLGKWIKRITEEYVEFYDGESVSIKEPDYRLIKPLIWW